MTQTIVDDREAGSLTEASIAPSTYRHLSASLSHTHGPCCPWPRCCAVNRCPTPTLLPSLTLAPSRLAGLGFRGWGCVEWQRRGNRGSRVLGEMRTKKTSPSPLKLVLIIFLIYFINAINRYFKPKLPNYIAILSKGKREKIKLTKRGGFTRYLSSSFRTPHRSSLP